MHKIYSFTIKYLQKPMIRYLIMASSLVVLELLSFFLLNNVLGISYLIATPASLTLILLLNWYLGRIFVFKKSVHRAHVEFILVMSASLVGIAIQMTTVFCTVELAGIDPFIAKITAIGVTFFWNYYVRQKFIFKNTKPSHSD